MPVRENKTPFHLVLDAKEREMRTRMRHPVWVSRGCKHGCQAPCMGIVSTCVWVVRVQACVEGWVCIQCVRVLDGVRERLGSRGQ